MRKSKNPETFPAGEFKDRLSALLSAASKSGLGDGVIAAALENHVRSYRERHLMMSPVESANTVPKLTRVGGNGSLRDRLTAALRGEIE
jgi:hypothetical protein